MQTCESKTKFQSNGPLQMWAFLNKFQKIVTKISKTLFELGLETLSADNGWSVDYEISF